MSQGVSGDGGAGGGADQAIAGRLAAAEALCAARGARLTDLRRDVLRLVLEAGEPVGAYALLDRLRPGGGKPPTIYRALDFLLAQGLVHRVERLNAFVGCAEAGHDHPAQFLICTACGRVVELEAEAVARGIAAAAAASGFIPRRITVEVEGNCASCAPS